MSWPTGDNRLPWPAGGTEFEDGVINALLQGTEVTPGPPGSPDPARLPPGAPSGLAGCLSGPLGDSAARPGGGVRALCATRKGNRCRSLRYFAPATVSTPGRIGACPPLPQRSGGRGPQHPPTPTPLRASRAGFRGHETGTCRARRIYMPIFSLIYFHVADLPPEPPPSDPVPAAEKHCGLPGPDFADPCGRGSSREGRRGPFMGRFETAIPRDLHR